MPIYMDRHDVPDGVTPEVAAQLHKQDSEIQSQFDVRMLTYWYDNNRKNAFCLAEAPNKQALTDLHNASHGDVAYRVIEVNLDVVESFLGRIEDPAPKNNENLIVIDESPFRTVMVIGIENFFQNSDSNELKSSLQGFSKSVTEMVNQSGGRVVSKNLDYFLVSFNSGNKAVNCALKIHSNYAETVAKHQAAFKNLRISLSADTPVNNDSEFFENAIKLAERMCSIEKKEIVISAEVKKLCMSENLENIANNPNVFTLTSSDEKFLNQLMDYTEKIWNNPALKVDNFHVELGYSKSQFYRNMMTLMGKSPNSFIKEYRLNIALKMLNEQKDNVSQIGFDSGFSSPSYFTKCFQTKFGISPTEYLQLKKS